MTTTIDQPVAPPTPAWTPRGTAHLIDVHSFVFWVVAVATVFGAMHLFHEITSNATVQAVPMIAWAALVQWGLYGCLFAWFVLSHQLYIHRAPVVLLGALAWGAFPAIYFAGHANAAFEDLMTIWLGTDAESDWVAAFSAATNEEALKLIGVLALFLLPRARLRGPIDGLYYGAMVGLGFQNVEDFMYTIQQSGSLADVFNFLFTRGFLTGMVAHTTYTAITGFALGYLIKRSDKTWGARLGVFVGVYAAVWALHVFWDAPVLQETFGDSTAAFYLVIVIKSVPILLLLALTLRWARDIERTRWNEFVGTYVDPSVVPPADVEMLQTRKSRRAAQHHARHAGGRRARRATELLQRNDLRYVQAVDEEGADSATAIEHAGRITALRDTLHHGATPA